MKRINKIIKRARGSKWRLHKKDFWNEANFMRKQKPCNCPDCSGGISKVYWTSADNIDFGNYSFGGWSESVTFTFGDPIPEKFYGLKDDDVIDVTSERSKIIFPKQSDN